ncbi:MAG: hypothetical protein H6739_19500 [Alphaproteobacteria bacterium]|nr:hypothetical protein [Alphaproteobacteria bacterium]
MRSDDELLRMLRELAVPEPPQVGPPPEQVDPLLETLRELPVPPPPQVQPPRSWARGPAVRFAFAALALIAVAGTALLWASREGNERTLPPIVARQPDAAEPSPEATQAQRVEALMPGAPPPAPQVASPVIAESGPKDIDLKRPGSLPDAYRSLPHSDTLPQGPGEMADPTEGDQDAVAELEPEWVARGEPPTQAFNLTLYQQPPEAKTRTLVRAFGDAPARVPLGALLTFEASAQISADGALRLEGPDAMLDLGDHALTPQARTLGPSVDRALGFRLSQPGSYRVTLSSDGRCTSPCATVLLDVR